MNKSHLSAIILSLAFSVSLYAQDISPTLNEPISLERAIMIALEQNHDISIARNTVQISENNASIGNAGLLPQLSASGGYQESIENTEVQFLGGEDGVISQVVNGANNTSLNASVQANYVLFDGFGNYYRFQSLKNLEEQAGVQSRLQIESTLVQVIQFFLSVNAEQDAVRISDESISRSIERLQRVKNRYELGNATRLDVLNAKVDLNADSVQFIQATNRLANAKRDLLIQLGADPEEEIQLVEDIPLNPELVLTDIIQDAQINNASLVLSRLASENTDLSLKQQRAGRFPVLSLFGSFDYIRNEFEAGQLVFQETDGFTGGISISVNLFNGFQRETEIQNAQIQLKNSRETLLLTQKGLRRDVMNLYEDYQTNLFLLNKELVNLETAQLNFERTKQLFELGQVTNTDFREAQLNISRVEQNMVVLKIQAKLSEIQLYQLSGKLIEQ